MLRGELDRICTSLPHVILKVLYYAQFKEMKLLGKGKV